MQTRPLDGKETNGGSRKLLWFNISVQAPRTSLDGLMQEAPPTLVHHVHVSFVVHQSGSNAF